MPFCSGIRDCAETPASGPKGTPGLRRRPAPQGRTANGGLRRNAAGMLRSARAGGTLVNVRNESHTPLTLGISSCLLGDRVRWDGDHERRSFLADVLAPHVTFVRVCPELEIGLGVPREPIALVREGAVHALVGAASRRDLTAAMASFAAARADGFEGLDGYVLKSRSPSCGLAGARVYADRATLFADGPFERSGRGLFAETLVRRRPLLPVVEELQLDTLVGQLHFAERCFAMRRARRLRAAIAGGAGAPAARLRGGARNVPA